MERDTPLANHTGLRLAIFDYLWRYWWLTIPLWCCLLAGRFVSGRNIVGGDRSTDATFVRPARETRKSWWANQRGVVRSGIRFAVIAALWLWAVAPVVVWIVLSLALVVLARAGVRRYRTRKHEKTMVWPVWPVIAGIIGVPDIQPASRWVDIPAPADTTSDVPAQRYDGTPNNLIELTDQHPHTKLTTWWHWLRGQVARLRPHHSSDTTAPLVPNPDEPIIVGLRAADADDDRRIRALVQLFNQRYNRPHHGYVDHSQRLAVIQPRPAEQPYWPYVAQILDVPADELQHHWMRVDTSPTGPRVVVTVPHGTFIKDAENTLKLLLQDEYGGDWKADSGRRNWRELVFYPKPPEPTPPTTVSFLHEHPDYQHTSNAGEVIRP